jgi:hypothetical protein
MAKTEQVLEVYYSLPDYARRSAEGIDAAIEQERHAWD